MALASEALIIAALCDIDLITVGMYAFVFHLEHKIFSF